MTVETYSGLVKVSGTVDSIDYWKDGKSHVLELNLMGDKRFFHQEFSRRFADNSASDVRPGVAISFYTSLKVFKVEKTFLAASDFRPFNYYPVFNINNDKSFLDVFLFYFYRPSVLTLLLHIAIVASVVYNFSNAVHSKGFHRILILLLICMMFWLMY